MKRRAPLSGGIGLFLQAWCAAAAAGDLAALPANAWSLLHEEDDSGGKSFARVVMAESADRLFLWGLGGTLLERNRFVRYELESFSPAEAKWVEALPPAKSREWADGKFPPFRIYGQGGTDGARMRTVGGYGACAVVEFREFDGTLRPSPVHTFNQVCWDSKRNRIVHFNGGRTFALDPATLAWTDLKPAATPVACQALAWGSLCYDPVNDEVLLFGGGLALNPEGGARTWLYDSAKNAWYRPKLELEPPLRCNAPIVYDPKSQAMVMFGGYDQSAALNDTWVYRCKERGWEKRTPPLAPPPMFAPATAAVPGGGRVLVCGTNALASKRNDSATRARRETWVYDIAANTWQPAGGNLDLSGYDWLTATGSEKHGVVFLVAFGPKRRTYAFRYDPQGPTVARKGAPPDTVCFHYRDQKEAIEAAPKPSIEAQAEFLAELPANQVVEAKPPATVVAKTWSSAVCDTDRGEIIYTGGGHSGYSGNDFAHYSVAANRWSLSWPPCFPPFLEGTNAAVFGWSYGCRPWSQHTYLWYAYDPQSKMVVYCARPTEMMSGMEVLLEDDPAKAFVYDAKKHGFWTYIYDPVQRKLFPPCFGRRFGNPWSLALAGTPKGVYAVAEGALHLGKVKDGKIEWTTVDKDAPKPKDGYNYEWQPIVYDSKRDRLLHLMGKEGQVVVHARPLAPGGTWTRETTVPGDIGREAVYIPKHDALVLLARKKLFALDCAQNRWRELDVEMPEGSYGTESTMVYDPVHDVCVLLIPRQFSGQMPVYLFRYAAASARYKDGK